MDKVRYLPRRTGSSSGSGNSMSPPPDNPAAYAAERARLLFGQYRKGDANDPEIYVATVAAILSDYPPETMRYVTDPRTGIAANPLADPETGRMWTGMPDAANVKRACELHHMPTRKMMEREEAIRRQLHERQILALEHQRPRKTYEQLEAELAEVGIFIGTDGKRPKAFDVNGFREAHGITKEQWDAIPNGKTNA
jgi:hypothetical protein